MATGKYDWDLWMDGKPHLAKQGEDYHCKTQSFVTMLRHQAFYANVKVSLQVVEGGSAVRFAFGKSPDQPAPKWHWHKGEKVYEDA